MTETLLSLDSIAQFQRSMSDNGKPANTVRAYGTDLKGLFLAMGEQPTWADLEAAAARYLTLNRTEFAPSTTRRKLAAFRAYAKHHKQTGFLEDYAAPRQVPGVAHPIEGGTSTVLKMIEVAKGPQHEAMVALNGLCGLRISEVIEVTVDDFTFTVDSIDLRVFGKGYKTRIVPVSDAAWSHLVPAFAAAMKLDDKRLVPINNRGARKAIKRIARRAGVEGASHDLRMSFGTDTYHASGNDIRTTQELLGHASTSTTEGYVGVTDAAKRKAVNIVRDDEAL